jgi:hypothetical protein
MRSQKLPYTHLSDNIAIINAVFGVTLPRQVKAYNALSAKLLAQHGEHYTVLYLKELYTQAVTYVTTGQIHEIPFRKTTKEGLCKDLRPFIPLFRGDENEIRAALTILRQYLLFYQRPVPDLKSITETGGSWLADFLIGKSFKLFVSEVPKETLQGSIQIVPRARAGPNGRSSLMSAHLDAVALTQRPKLLDSLHKLSRIIDPKLDLKEWVEHLAGWAQSNGTPMDQTYNVGRLVALAEGGHKTRTIAIGDLFSQAVLLPLHKSLMKRLRDIRVDGTWDQSKSIALVKAMTKKGPVYSFDLTSATDRFPAFLQGYVIAAIYGDEVGALWLDIMKNLRDFSFRDQKVKTEGIHYMRGQGMGLYSSWPAFALTHHYLLRMIGAKVGLPSFQDYTIIGDDVVIGNREVAKEYQATLRHLGVPISQAKSIVSENQPYAAEICKRIIRDGVDLSPLPPDLINIVSKDFRQIPTMLTEIRNRYGLGIKFPARSTLHTLQFLYNDKKKRRSALILLTAPAFYARVGVQPLYGNIDFAVANLRADQCPPGEEGYWPWLEIDPEILLDLPAVHDQMRKAYVMREYEMVFRDWNIVFTDPPTIRTALDHEPVTLDPRHPFWSARDYILERLESLAGYRIAILGREDEFSMEEIGIQFAMDPGLRPFRDRKRTNSQTATHLTLGVFKVLKGEASYPEIKHPEGGLLTKWTEFQAH